ncbi:uncharacterized protein LOC125501288 [Athalia rosae]|uniref:uncharacterized protein LOC125501288 n=1 Tax=Athalia rosae TaxID=37344 RepID=UPI00203355B0|nr:uncharacterized protein LOC125501288 [Athalia rosae]
MLDLAPPKEIFDDVCRRNPAVAINFSFAVIESAIQRVRTKLRPATRATLRDLGAVLIDYAPTEQSYRGVIEATDGSVAVMFASEKMLRRLGNSPEIYVDGTFKVVPNSPPIAQLYTIHMRVMDTGLAAVFILCSAKTKALCTAVFRKILELATEIEQSLRFAMGDYEHAAMSALRELFPAVSLHGCWFYF